MAHSLFFNIKTAKKKYNKLFCIRPSPTMFLPPEERKKVTVQTPIETINHDFTHCFFKLDSMWCQSTHSGTNQQDGFYETHVTLKTFRPK